MRAPKRRDLLVQPFPALAQSPERLSSGGRERQLAGRTRPQDRERSAGERHIVRAVVLGAMSRQAPELLGEGNFVNREFQDLLAALPGEHQKAHDRPEGIVHLQSGPVDETEFVGRKNPLPVPVTAGASGVGHRVYVAKSLCFRPREEFAGNGSCQVGLAHPPALGDRRGPHSRCLPS